MVRRGEQMQARRRGPRPGTPRAPRMTRAERERQLLDVAEETFAEQGYSETTMEQIAGRAGITKPVIYDHFGSKDRLLAAVVNRNRDDLLAATRSALVALEAGADPVEYFRAGVRAFLEFFQERRESFRTYQQQAAVLATAGGDIEQLRQAQAVDVAERLAFLPGVVRLSEDMRMGLSEVVIATNERVTAWWLRHPDVTLEEAVELVMTVVWRGIGSLVTDPADG